MNHELPSGKLTWPMAMENGPFEDVSLLKIGIFQPAMLVYWSVPQLQHVDNIIPVKPPILTPRSSAFTVPSNAKVPAGAGPKPARKSARAAALCFTRRACNFFRGASLAWTLVTSKIQTKVGKIVWSLDPDFFDFFGMLGWKSHLLFKKPILFLVGSKLLILKKYFLFGSNPKMRCETNKKNWLRFWYFISMFVTSLFKNEVLFHGGQTQRSTKEDPR